MPCWVFSFRFIDRLNEQKIANEIFTFLWENLQKLRIIIGYEGYSRRLESLILPGVKKTLVVHCKSISLYIWTFDATSRNKILSNHRHLGEGLWKLNSFKIWISWAILEKKNSPVEVRRPLSLYRCADLHTSIVYTSPEVCLQTSWKSPWRLATSMKIITELCEPLRLWGPVHTYPYILTQWDAIAGNVINSFSDVDILSYFEAINLYDAQIPEHTMRSRFSEKLLCKSGYFMPSFMGVLGHPPL